MPAGPHAEGPATARVPTAGTVSGMNDEQFPHHGLLRHVRESFPDVDFSWWGRGPGRQVRWRDGPTEDAVTTILEPSFVRGGPARAAMNRTHSPELMAAGFLLAQERGCTVWAPDRDSPISVEWLRGCYSRLDRVAVSNATWRSAQLMAAMAQFPPGTHPAWALARSVHQNSHLISAILN